MVERRITEPTESKLYVTWRHPEGLIHPVGLLTQRVSNGSESYRFVYLKRSESLGESFPPLPGLPDLHRVYESEDLFPVFRNRQMSRRRPDYKEYVRKLGLDIDTDPFVVMANSQGRKLTDRIELFAPPTRTEDANLTTSFFARGIRHREGAPDAVTALRSGDVLTLVDEPNNEVNPRAILIAIPEGTCVGWVPDYLVDTVHELRDLASEQAVSITAERVNPPDVAPNMRLICRLTAPWPDNFEPLSEPDFLPIGS